MRGGLAGDRGLLGRFENEVKVISGLQHPNIVSAIDFGEENGNPYLVMEYLDGTPADKIIAQRQGLEVIQKLDIIIGVLKALDYAHEHGVIHRDVKPANVHVLKDGSVKLLDFGIAREGNLDQIKTGQIIGTMSYMAPEQMNGEAVDHRGDIFSTGIMLFELLTYSMPFEDRDVAAVIVQRIRGDPPTPLSKYLEDYPLELDDIIAKATARDLEKRYARAEEFAIDLERVRERLKRDRVSYLVDEARASIADVNLVKAKALLLRALRIDAQNPTAEALFSEVQTALQRLERLRAEAL
jgi:serine/threonine-protein kinase